MILDTHIARNQLKWVYTQTKVEGGKTFFVIIKQNWKHVGNIYGENNIAFMKDKRQQLKEDATPTTQLDHWHKTSGLNQMDLNKQHRNETKPLARKCHYVGTGEPSSIADKYPTRQASVPLHQSDHP